MKQKEQQKQKEQNASRREIDFTIIGAAIIDILARPVTPDVFLSGSQPVKEVRLCYGGDALNEAVVLARFGKRVDLFTKVGGEEAGKQELAF